MTREEIRQSLILKYGCRQADYSVESQRNTVLDVSKLLTKVFKYTPDNELTTEPFLLIKRGRPEQWVSRHVEIAEGKIPVKGDCDDYTMTGIQLSLILGVNPSRLAVLGVVDDKVIRSSVAVKPQVNHLIGGFLDNQVWSCCFDTWNIDASQEYLVPVGEGRRPQRNARHSAQLIAVVSEGLSFKAYPNSWVKIIS